MHTLRAGLSTLCAALSTEELRRAQAAWAAMSLGTWAFYVVLAIYAYGEGGAAGVGHRVGVAPGEVVIREGDSGDRCFLVAEGEIALSKLSGWSASMGPGDFFGEIALLRDEPRNATATAAGPGLLLVLARDDFLGAVTGHVRTREAADALVAERLASGDAQRL